MKRLLLVLLVSTAAVKADDSFAQTWKELSSYRATSGAKAALTSVLGYFAVKAAYNNGCRFGTELGNISDNRSFWKEKFPALCETGVCTGGMAYTSYALWIHYFWPYAKHALAIK